MARVEADAPARTAPSAASPPANTSPPVAACPAPPARSPAAAEAPAPVVPLSAAEETLEEKVAAKWPRARVQRVAASATKPSALLEKLVNLACTNVRQYCSAAELRAKRSEISASTVVAILLDDRLLGYAAYRTHEREGDVSDLVTYLFELHRDMKDALAKGAGSLLEAEVEAAAAAAGQRMMLTVAEKNPARAFYGEKRWLLDRSSPQNHTSCASYLIMRKNPLDSETIGERDARFWEAEPPEEEPPKKKRRLSPRANRNIPLDEALDRLRLRQITTQGYNNNCLAFAVALSSEAIAPTMLAQQQAEVWSDEERLRTHTLLIERLEAELGKVEGVELSNRAKRRIGDGAVWWQGTSIALAESIFQRKKFMCESHAAVFANRLQREIVVIDARNRSRVAPLTLVHYPVGFEAWKAIGLTQAKVMRDLERQSLWLVMQTLRCPRPRVRVCRRLRNARLVS